MNPTSKHIYRDGCGVIELSIDCEDKFLTIRSYDLVVKSDPTTIKIKLKMLPDLVDALIDFQNLPEKSS